MPRSVPLRARAGYEYAHAGGGLLTRCAPVNATSPAFMRTEAEVAGPPRLATGVLAGRSGRVGPAEQALVALMLNSPASTTGVTFAGIIPESNAHRELG